MDTEAPQLNRFLYKIALALPQIRDRLGLTQVALAEKAGISKPTIVAIEGNPARLSRSQALALILVITSELDQRASAAKSIDYSDIAKAATKLAAAGITAKTLQVALGTVAGAFLLPTAIAATIPFLFRNKAQNQAEPSSTIDPSTLKKLANESIDVIRKEIMLLLGVKSLAPKELMEEIEKNEPPKNPS